MVSVVVLYIVLLIVSKQRIKIIAVTLPLLLLIPLMPGDVLRRLTLIFVDPKSFSDVRDEREAGSVGSQIQRTELLKRSLWETARHPVFGLGPGMFIEATQGDNRVKGIHSAALGTHNSYTQVSSETGIPGLIGFLGAIVVGIRRMRRLHSLTENQPGFHDVAALAFVLWLCLLGSAVNIFFYHAAYGATTAVLLGLATALWLSAERMVQQLVRSGTQPRAA